MKTSLNVVFYNCIVHQINIATKSKFKIVSKRHVKKLDKFQKSKGLMRNDTKCSVYIEHTVHNLSSYALSDEACKALSYGLDHEIPTPCNYNAVEIELELFYQKTLSNISHISENEFMQLKSKLQNVWHLHNKRQVPYKYQNIIANLKNNRTVKVLKQDKGKSVAIMDSSKYAEKCLELPEKDRFLKINNDPT